MLNCVEIIKNHSLNEPVHSTTWTSILRISQIVSPEENNWNRNNNCIQLTREFRAKISHFLAREIFHFCDTSAIFVVPFPQRVEKAITTPIICSLLSDKTKYLLMSYFLGKGFLLNLLRALKLVAISEAAMMRF